jgi:HAMP domain-containing protein
MIVNCEECGQRYSIDTAKMTGETAKYKCRVCNHINTVVKSSPIIDQGPMSVDMPPLGSQIGKEMGTKKTSRQTPPKIRGIGLRTKMMVLFILVPVLLMVGASLFCINQMKELSYLITGDSTKMVQSMAEQIIIEKGRSVAREVKLYLDTHPGLKKEDFNKTPEFVKIAMQKVGETGYTLLTERETNNKPEIMWVHPNPKLVGIDITDAMKKKLGDKWALWDKIRSKPYETKGYYLWFDNKQKYCAGIPIEGTPYNIVSSTYIDEFLKPVEGLHQRVDSMTGHTMNIVIYILAAAAILVALIAFLYGNSVYGKIMNLMDVADRISIGELDAEVAVKSKDEIGALGEAIRRMQDSIRISLDRLRRQSR